MEYTDKKGLIIKILLFFLASVITVVFIPRENVFRYEFRKGSPWAYDDLIAAHNFPILKSEKKLKEERDSLAASVKPIYEYDSVVAEEAIERIDRDMEEYKKSLKDTDLTELKEYQFKSRKELDSLIVGFEAELKKEVKKLYGKNILQLEPQNFDNFVVLHGKLGIDYNTDDCLTEKAAYNQLIKFAEQHSLPLKPEFDYENYIKANIFPDTETYEKIKTERINDISPYEGMVQAGERIIAKGELIGETKYRILLSYKEDFRRHAESDETQIYAVLGQWMIFAFFYAIFFFSLMFFEEKSNNSVKTSIYFLTGTVFYAVFAGIISHYDSLSPYLLPILILPVLTVTFFDARTAILHHTVTLVIVSFILPNGFDYFVMQFISGFAIALGLLHLRRRGQILQAAFYVATLQAVIYLLLTLIYENTLVEIDTEIFLWILINSVFIPVAYPLVYLFERVFGFISDVSLIELSDTNRPLLRMLSEQAPGSFQHSVQVANIAEEAVRKIDGDALLVRAGALYHDIGKSANPAYFTENQLSGKNLHDELEPLESAEIIINHVKHGIEIAEKHHLPMQIREFINTHHADGKVRWFLHAYKQQNPEEEVDEKLFSYPGKKPRSKEAAVVMMADAVEAASRSMKEYKPETISALVDKLIDYQVSENMFSETELTFSELKTIRQAFKDKLMNIYHSRIEYPEDA